MGCVLVLVQLTRHLLLNMGLPILRFLLLVNIL